MRRVFVAPLAKQDVVSILLWTYETFGENARLRYQLLLAQATQDIAQDDESSTSRPDLGNFIKTYHLSFSRNHIKDRTLRVKNPRHFFVCRVDPKSDIVEIVRVLHDNMDPQLHMPFHK